MKELPRLPRLGYRPTRLRHVQADRTGVGRWRGEAQDILVDLEAQAWPKGVPYGDQMAGAQIGTLPERRVLWWLLYRKKLSPVEFIFQSDTFGMPATPVAVQNDFVIFRGPSAIVWEIQGEQWHYRFNQRTRDAAKMMRVLGQWVAGHRVTDYVEIWEHDINMSNSRRNDVCDLAYNGKGIGR